MTKENKVLIGVGTTAGVAILGGLTAFLVAKKKKSNAAAATPVEATTAPVMAGWEPPELPTETQDFLAEKESPPEGEDFEKPRPTKPNGVDYPYEISPEDFEFTKQDIYDKVSLTWYTEDQALADENGDLVIGPDKLFGPELTHYIEYCDGKAVYIRNDQRGTDYEVCIEHSSYSRDVLGEDDDE